VLLVLKVYIIFTYVHVYVHVCYVVVLQVDEGAPIPFWLVVFSIKTCFDNEIKPAIVTKKYDKKQKGIKFNHFDARPLHLCT